MKKHLNIGGSGPLTGCIGGLALLTGCATAAPPVREAHQIERAEVEAAKMRAAELEAELSARRSEIRRLESEVALLRAERSSAPRSVSIVSDGAVWDEPASEYAESDGPHEARPGERRVTLKLYGEREETLTAQTFDHGLGAASGSSPAPRFEPTREALSHYRAALAAIRERRLESALPLLELAIERAPSVTHRIDAVYWRGEVLYLLGRHVEAEVEFAVIVSSEIAHARLPASLLRLGQCRSRRGLKAEAASIFERLRSEFPGSHAAAQVPREGV